MARMRWMRDEETGRTTAVCMRCDAEVAVDPLQTFYCFCRTSGVRGDVVAHALHGPEVSQAA